MKPFLGRRLCSAAPPGLGALQARSGLFEPIVAAASILTQVDPKPFMWTKPADVILAQFDRLPVPSV